MRELEFDRTDYTRDAAYNLVLKNTNLIKIKNCSNCVYSKVYFIDGCSLEFKMISDKNKYSCGCWRYE